MSLFAYNPDDSFSDIIDLEVMQESFLHKHLEYCRDNSPYYQKILSGRDFSTFKLKDLKELPFTSKSDMSNPDNDFIAVPRDKIVDIVFSSGTTGAPCKIVYTEHDLQRLAYNEEKAFSQIGVQPGDRVLLTCTLDRCFIAGLAYFLGIRKIGASAIRNGINSITSHAKIIKNLEPEVIVGVPSFLVKLGKFLHESDYPVNTVKRLVCIGEPIRDENLELSSIGTKLQELWDANVYSTYASSETITTFAECNSGCGGHLEYDLGILEIVDDNGEQVAAGELGEVVVTPLQMHGTPLVRLLTGDISFMHDTPCACGRSTMRLGPILGRKSQMLKVRGTTIFPQAIFSELASIPHVDEYYIEVKGKHLADEIEVFVVLSIPGTSLSQIAEKIYAVTRVSLRVSEVDRQTAFAKIFPEHLRKPNRFIDLR